MISLRMIVYLAAGALLLIVTSIGVKKIRPIYQRLLSSNQRTPKNLHVS